MKWEYLVADLLPVGTLHKHWQWDDSSGRKIEIPRHGDELSREEKAHFLNALGAEGWEIVGITGSRYVFKRRATD